MLSIETSHTRSQPPGFTSNQQHFRDSETVWPVQLHQPRTQHLSSGAAARLCGILALVALGANTGGAVGDGRRGSMEALVAAILMDAEARSDDMLAFDTFGKIREPAIRFVQWARAFDASSVTPQNSFDPYDPTTRADLGQSPYESPSVFNFYRPGYIAPGSATGAVGMTVPELQITNSSTLVGYANFMAHFAFADALNGNDQHNSSFIPDYTDERALASDPAALVDHLNTLLASGQLSDEVRNNIVQTVGAIPLTNENVSNYDGQLTRIGTAVLMVMTSPEYLVQR